MDENEILFSLGFRIRPIPVFRLRCNFDPPGHVVAVEGLSVVCRLFGVPTMPNQK